MTDSQCKHLVSKSIFTRFVFHPSVYIQMRGLGLVFERLSLPGLRHIQVQAVTLLSRELTHIGYSVKKDDPIPQPIATDGLGLQLPSPSSFPLTHILHISPYKDASGAWPFPTVWPLLLCSSHYSGILLPLPYPHHNRKKDVLVHRFMWYCLLPFYVKEGNRKTLKHCLPCCCHPDSRDKHIEDIHLTCMPSQLHPWVAFLEGADDWQVNHGFNCMPCLFLEHKEKKY